MPATRGRIDKRQAILDAAFTVFARDGYRPASVDTVAATAGVAKHTIYNHFGDKQSLFRAAVAALADDSLARNLTALEVLRADRDPAEALTEVGLKLADCYCDEKSWALRRLLYAELASMPELQDVIRDRATDRVNDALADRLARLALAGKLRITDPAVAAEQFGALLTAPLETRSRLGTRKIPARELAEVTQNAVQTFLRAFGSE
ncbi:TetR/AcrR family transcriptional regulator C-terminal domain-containing protein [Kribbella sp. NPDC054772]